MENTTPNLNMGSTPNMGGAPVHHSHKGLIWSLIIIIVVILAAIFILKNDSMMDSDDNTIDATADTEVLENTSDDLGSIEADINSLDFEGMDAELE